MRYSWIAFGLIGVWHLASAATPGGLMPSGHGAGIFFEIVFGLMFIWWAHCRFTTRIAGPSR